MVTNGMGILGDAKTGKMLDMVTNDDIVLAEGLVLFIS